MRRQLQTKSNVPNQQAKQYMRVAKARTMSSRAALSARARGGQRNVELPFAPPEDWHEPTGAKEDYRIIVQDPGDGYRHVVTPAEVRERLAQMPAHFLKDLEVVQFSRMTNKKQSFPCYGMQWGSALYLYPLEDSLVEYFSSPPPINLVNETRMYGARWVHEAPSTWHLVWTEKTIRDFYLNNILIHELGHLLDDRNNSYVGRERFAEWFAIHHGYLPSQAARQRGMRKKRKVVRRHHAK